MEAKWSSLVSYGLSLDALQDFLPIDLSLDVKTVRYDTLKVAKRLEAELGEDQASFIEGAPRDWDLLPQPDGSFKVGIDGAYVRHWFDKKHKFEVIIGKSIVRFEEDEEEDKTPSLKRFGFVQTLDTKSKQRGKPPIGGSTGHRERPAQRATAPPRGRQTPPPMSTGTHRGTRWSFPADVPS
jgi:hypothetical protein